MHVFFLTVLIKSSFTLCKFLFPSVKYYFPLRVTVQLTCSDVPGNVICTTGVKEHCQVTLIEEAMEHELTILIIASYKMEKSRFPKQCGKYFSPQITK